jgi:hypothetical protein
MSDTPRPRDLRKAEVLRRLAAPVADCWVATASSDGEPYLVPLTMAWFQERIILATARRSPTARNLAANGRARVGLGPTRDVILIEAALESTMPVSSEAVGDAYAKQNDWDPREAGDGYVFLALRPVKIQAWREENEIPDRLLMRDGEWLA